MQLFIWSTTADESDCRGSKKQTNQTTLTNALTPKPRIKFHDSSSIRGVAHSLEKVIPRAEFVITSEMEVDDKIVSKGLFFYA